MQDILYNLAKNSINKLISELSLKKPDKIEIISSVEVINKFDRFD